MSARLYRSYKAKHDGIKPIRGKDIRPIGKRRRTNETIREVEVEGVKGIACRLYNTDCVTYLENGDVLLSTGGFNTNTTRAFINAHAPGVCLKQDNYLWVKVDGTYYPLPRGGETLLLREGYDAPGMYEYSAKYSAIHPHPVKQEVVDRTMAKQARVPLMPFLNWAKAMLTLSDGFVALDITKMPNAYMLSEDSPFRWRGPNWGYEKQYEYLCNQTEEQYLSTLHLFIAAMGVVRNWRDGGCIVHFDALKAQLYKIAERGNDCYTLRDVEPGPRPIKNLRY